VFFQAEVSIFNKQLHQSIREIVEFESIGDAIRA